MGARPQHGQNKLASTFRLTAEAGHSTPREETSGASTNLIGRQPDNEGSTHVSGRFWRSVKYQHLLIYTAAQLPLWNASGSAPASSGLEIRRKTRSRICGRIGLMDKN